MPSLKTMFFHLGRRRKIAHLTRHARSYHELSFLERGDPSKVLEYYSQGRSLPDPPKGSVDDFYVRVEMLHAPWNPADKNTIQGKYPSPVSHPPSQPPSLRGPEWRVAGSEGWGRIVETTLRKTNISQPDSWYVPGTYVTFGQSGMGTFRSSMWLPKSALIPIEHGNDLLEVATTADDSKARSSSAPEISSLFQLGGTALRMLCDFESLEENSLIVQNAGNSGVGWMVSQLASARNIRVISLVRKGSKSATDFGEMANALTQQSTNSTTVVAEEDLVNDNDALEEVLATFDKPPRLAINAVGGASASLLLKMLATGGTMVTYGGMSMKPVTVATPQLIFKDVRVRGYWHSRWMAQSFAKQRKKMVDELVDAVLHQNVKCPPVQVFSLCQMQKALEFEIQQSNEPVRRKVIFDCREEIGDGESE